MWIRYTALILIAFVAGISIAGAFVAFITLIGILPALARQERFFAYPSVVLRMGAWLFGRETEGAGSMANVMYLYESLIIAGVFLGTLCSLFEPTLHLGYGGLTVFTFLGGMYTGCLVGALEETLNVYPIVSRRTKIRHGMGYVLTAAAAGKCVGSILYFFVLKL
ncbi:MAG: stage V sporulation protein AB [Lachnospiraceae bacterium]|nr:stage V sporulation protein AB [Lachnospiraceae bacterium]